MTCEVGAGVPSPRRQEVGGGSVKCKIRRFPRRVGKEYLGEFLGPEAVVYVFFFQAEDGIRDGRVTGVQTCALPIFERLLPAALSQRSLAERRGKPRCQRGPFPRHKSTNKQRRRNYFPSCLAERSLVEKWQTLRRSTTYRRTRRFLISVHAELPLRIGRQVRVDRKPSGVCGCRATQSWRGRGDLRARTDFQPRIGLAGLYSGFQVQSAASAGLRPLWPVRISAAARTPGKTSRPLFAERHGSAIRSVLKPRIGHKSQQPSHACATALLGIDGDSPCRRTD